MADAAAEEVQTIIGNAVPITESEGQVFGLLDVMIYVSLLGLVAYWFYPRKSKAAIINHLIDRRASELTDSSFITKMKLNGRRVIVFYGSQTGTAEEFAARLVKEANRYGMKAMSADPEEYDMEDLCRIREIEDSMVIFCMATYGEGDPTDNAMELNNWLKAGDVDFAGLNYAVFGLGNSTYENYNSMGKFVDSRLQELGATRIYALGLGDDEGSLEEDFITWKEKFWGAVCECFDIQTLGEDVTFRQYELVLGADDQGPGSDDEGRALVFTGETSRLHSYRKQKPPYDAKNPFLAPITVRRELYKGSRSCMHLELDMNGAKTRYDSGDHVAIFPTNQTALVEKMGKLLNVDLDTVFSLNNLDQDSSKIHPFPCPTTYRTALLHYVDITSIPRTHILKEISEYATDEEHKRMLKTMASSSEEGRSLYLNFVVKNCRSIIHILEDMPSLKPPLDHVLELLPRLQARYYSISSSAKVHPTSIHVTAVVVDYETPTQRPVAGVATGWLRKLPLAEPPPRVPVFVRRSTFHLPSKSVTPVVMIGPGTGLAPFRGFVQERQRLRAEGHTVGETILYFGCRKASEDFLYREELEAFLADGSLSKLYLAFSRDQPEKVYVTHLLQRNKEELWRLIGQKGGHIYVCGDARNMAKDVHKIIVECVEQYGNLTKFDAEKYVKKMESQRRYAADVWS